MKKLTPLFLSAAALVALSPEVANAQVSGQVPVDPEGITGNQGEETPKDEVQRPQPVQPEQPGSTDLEEDVYPVTTDDEITEVEERKEQDVTDAVLDESSIDVDQIYHTPIQVDNEDAEDAEKQYEYDAVSGDRLDYRDKNEVQVRFTVNDQNRLVNKEGQAGSGDRVTLENIDATGNAANSAAGAANFKLVNRNSFGPQTIQLNDFDGQGLFTSYKVTAEELEDGTFDHFFELAFRIPNNSISTVYDLIGTFIDENNNTIESLITPINVVHQDALIEIRDENTHPDVEAYQPDEDVEVPFRRITKYIPHDQDVYVITSAGNGYEVGDIVVPGENDDWDEDQVRTYNLNLGERIVARNGVKGLETIYYKQEFVDGSAVTEVIVDNFRPEAAYEGNISAIDEIVLVGAVITNVDRVSGVDRFQNSVQLSREGWNEDNDELISEWGNYGSHVFVANADRYADSLTGTPLAAANGAPILLTRGNTLNGAVATELARLYNLFTANQETLNQETFGVTVLGGINSISQDVATAISTALLNDDGTNADTYEIDRIGGIDRYHQAYLVAEELERINRTEQAEEANSNPEDDEDDTVYTAADFTADFDNIYIASGDVFSDALAIAAQAGEYRNPVLLTRGNTLNEYAANFLETYINADSVEAVHNSNVNIVGGTSTISAAVANQINEILADKVETGVENDINSGEIDNDQYYTNPDDSTPKPVTVGRIAGANRYEVSRNVNEDATYTDNESGAEAAYTHYLVVSGDHPSDALPASALANQIGAGVLLVSNNTQRAREQLIAAIENGVTDFTFIGGVNTLSEDTLNIFNYTGDTIRAIIEGPEDFSDVINDGPLSGLL